LTTRVTTSRPTYDLAAEVQGGLMSAVASLPQTVPMGVVVFAPFGATAIAHGVVAALVATVIGGTIVGAFGPMKAQIAGPRSGSAMVLAQLSAFLVAVPGIAGPDGPSLARALPIIALAVAAAGLIQIAAGAAGLARLIKYLPLPVLSGFTLALGAAMVAGTLPAFLGLPLGARLGEMTHLGALVPALAAWATVGFYAAARAFGGPLPPIVVAFLGGLGVSLAGEHLLPGSVAPLAAAAALPVSPFAFDWAASLRVLAEWDVAFGVAGFVAVLGLISSIDSLLSIVACDARTGADTDANRELAVEGAANVVSALAGGFTISASIARTAVNLAAGARGPLSALIAAAVSGLLLFSARPAEVIPSGVLQGILFVIGCGLYDGRLGVLVAGLRAPERRRKGQVGEVAILLGTAATTLAWGATVGIATGLAAAIALFLFSMSRPVIVAESTGRRRRSRRTRPPAQAEYLFARGDDTVIADLEGPIFFGTADQVRRWSQARYARPPVSLILNLDRIFDIDATGAAVLVQAARRFTVETGAAVAVTGVRADDPRFKVLAEAQIERVCHRFDDLDHALEWAEDRLLDDASPEIAGAVHRPIPLVAGASPEQLAVIEARLEHRRFAAGEVIFRQGEEGDALYFLEEGAVRIEWQGGGRPIRLATLTPGVVFGEMSLIDGAPRSAGARAEEPSRVLRLGRDALETLAVEHPDVALLLMRGLAADVARRLRFANAALSEQAG
jgi:SulP family sulfate permease